MAKSAAIRNIQTINQRIYVSYTYGDPPIGNVATAEVSYENETALKNAISGIENTLGEEGLVLLHLAITYLLQNGQFANLQQVLNKTITLDPFAAQPLKVT